MIIHRLRSGLASTLASLMLLSAGLARAEDVFTHALTAPRLGTLPVATQGLPGGVPVTVRVNGPSVKARIGIDAATSFQLQALKPGKYQINLDAIQFSGYTWEPEQPVLKVALNRKGEFTRLPSREPLTGPLPLAYTLTNYPAAPATAKLFVATHLSWSPIGPGPGFLVCDPAKPDSCSSGRMGWEFSNNTYINAFVQGERGEPTYFAGLSSGHIAMCDWSDRADELGCIQIDFAGTPINTLLVVNDVLYAGLDNGYIWNCPFIGITRCSDMDRADSPITALTYGNNRLYAGLRNGVIWSCSPTNTNDCNTHFDAGGNTVNSLVYANNRLYAGLANGLVLSCDPTTANTCTTLVDLSNQSYPVNAMLYANNRLYIGTGIGFLLGCDPNLENVCTNLGFANAPIGALAFGNNRIYASIQNGAVLSCDPNQGPSCFNLAKPEPGSHSPPSNGIIYIENPGS